MQDRSWHGRESLKQLVLTQMESHLEKASLEDLHIDDLPLNIYGWPKPIDFPSCAHILGLDEGVLQLGCYLFDGFPEDKKGIRDLIRLRMSMFEQVPVRADLSQVCNEFMVWRLEQADFGITSPDISRQVNDLLNTVVDAFYQNLPDGQILQANLRTALQDTEDRIAAQWQKEKTVDPDLYRKANALQVLAAASRAGSPPTSARNAAETYIHAITNGGNQRDSDAEHSLMSEKFIALLQAAPRKGE